MNILVTLPEHEIGEEIFPVEAVERLEELGDVRYNETDGKLSGDELRTRLADVDVVVTRWSGNPRLTEEILADADRLELVAHVGGSVSVSVTEAVYDRGVTVCSAVRVMGKYVAEATLVHVLSSLRELPQYSSEMAEGGWERRPEQARTMFDKTVGLVGLGSVGRELLSLLEPFDVDVLVNDPYVDPDELVPFEFATKASLDRVLSEPDIVSVHAGKTEETLHLLDADRLAMLQDGALLVNTARGAIIDEEALVSELRSGRISASIDVFETEPLPDESELRSLNNVVLTPHVAGSPTGRRMALTMVDEIERFKMGEPLSHEITRERARRMTNPRLSADDIQN